MSIAKTYSAQLIGLESHPVTVEVDISNGLHAFSVVGLGDRSVDEAKDRISSAIKNSGFVSPKQKNQKVVVSLAPAHVRKEGSSFDLAMALAYLSASGDISFDPERVLFLGELSLDGQIRRVDGVVPTACQATKSGFDTLFVPVNNVPEATIANDICVFGVSSLIEIVRHMKGESVIPISAHQDTSVDEPICTYDISAIRGNDTAKRGLEIAAAGGHNVMLYGPPGTGKTMLARSFHSLLPRLPYEQSIEVTSIYSAAHLRTGGIIRYPPLRSPHHTASYASIVGGGNVPRPGEITLAHCGVLFMDEMPEFDKDVIEALRQPLEDREITISRAHGSVTFPARCILIGSMNPCPCGLGQHAGCRCPEYEIRRYQRKLSQPIIDRIDVWIPVTKIDYDKLASGTVSGESSATIRERVLLARNAQKRRFDTNTRRVLTCNSDMQAQDIDKIVTMDESARSVLRTSAERMNLSGRAFHRVIKVAQTISDLTGNDIIHKHAILEALQYRNSPL